MIILLLIAVVVCGGCCDSETAPPPPWECEEPRTAAYVCEPEWVAEGRRCDGRCDLAGEDVWLCTVPPGGTGAPWAPPSCVLLDGGGGQRRYCCAC